MAYDSKTECRKWQLTINNPVKLGFDHRKITELLMRFKPSYFCMADEISESGTPHTHAFIMADSPIRFTTLKSRFPIAHLEMAKGSAQENRDYITKSGKWSDTDKAHTSVEDTFEEWGEVPTPKKEKAPVMTQVMEAIKAGKTTAEIVEEHPGLAFKIQQIDTLRQTLLAEKYMTENRDIKVTYMYGATGAGKTRSIYAKHSPIDVCRITNYSSKRGINFDGYSAQTVLVFEEFAGQISLEDMLSYLDIYPVRLPARYTDRVACYSTVYITSNLPLEQQYIDMQIVRPETWRAFLRRIETVIEYKADGSIIEHQKEEFLL